MADYNLSSNMNMPIPIVGIDPGPDWALNYNVSLTLVDGHDHSNGNGVQITPTGLNINADLPFNSNNAVDLKSVRFAAQSSFPAVAPNLTCVYVIGADLYYNDANGNQIRITQSGTVAGSSGTITGLPSGTASASYNSLSQTFVFQSASNTPANIDGGSILIREVAASANAVTVSSPPSLSGNYTLVLPTGLPASQKIMTLDNAGNIAAAYDVDNVTIEIASNNLQVKDLGISTAKIANNAVGTAQLANNAVTTNQIADGSVTLIKQAGRSLGTGAGQVSYSGNVTSTSVNPGSGTVTLCSLSATIVNSPMRIFIQDTGNGTAESYIEPGGNSTGFLYIFRDGSPIAKYRLDGVGGSPLVLSSHLIDILDPSAPGVHTYALVCQVSIGTVDFHNLRITAYEI